MIQLLIIFVQDLSYISGSVEICGKEVGGCNTIVTMNTHTSILAGNK